MSSVCQSCGHANTDDANFCSSCGARLAVEERTITFHPESLEAEAEPGAAGQPASGASLVVTRGPYAGSRFSLGEGTTTVGRHPDSDIFLDDVTVSRRHVEIEAAGDTFAITDVGSLNGTYVNRERVEKTHLSNGDELQIGKFKLTFFVGDDQAEDPASPSAS